MRCHARSSRQRTTSRIATCIDRGDCWHGNRRKVIGTLSFRPLRSGYRETTAMPHGPRPTATRCLTLLLAISSTATSFAGPLAV